MDSKLHYIQSGSLYSDVLDFVTGKTEHFINTLVKEKGIALADNTLTKIYNFAEIYARQLTDVISSESMNDRDFNFSDKNKTNIYLP